MGEAVMICPDCGAETDVKDSRPANNNRAIRRRRLCPRGHRFTTYEEVAQDPRDPDSLAATFAKITANIHAQLDALKAIVLETEKGKRSNGTGTRTIDTERRGGTRY